MPHYVPFFEWSDAALALRQFNYECWCEHGHGPNMRDVQCDSMNFVIDADHAERFERQVCRRGVVFTLEQAKAFVNRAVGERTWNYRKPTERMDPAGVIEGVRSLGVDVTNGGG